MNHKTGVTCHVWKEQQKRSMRRHKILRTGHRSWQKVTKYKKVTLNVRGKSPPGSLGSNAYCAPARPEAPDVPCPEADPEILKKPPQKRALHPALGHHPRDGPGLRPTHHRPASWARPGRWRASRTPRGAPPPVSHLCPGGYGLRVEHRPQKTTFSARCTPPPSLCPSNALPKLLWSFSTFFF